jgi:hypothetical protein
VPGDEFDDNKPNSVRLKKLIDALQQMDDSAKAAEKEAKQLRAYPNRMW